jgi:uncharacterized membrane protein
MNATREAQLRRLSVIVLGLAFVGVGILHFVMPAFFLRIMPSWIPWHAAAVAVSGVFEILGGLGVLVPQTRRLAGLGLIALLVAVFPANVHMALNPSDFADIASPDGLWWRLPMQPMLMVWVWWTTRPEAPRS